MKIVLLLIIAGLTSGVLPINTALGGDTLEFCGKKWGFNVGADFPGAQGTLAVLPEKGPKGQAAILLEGAFGSGGRYVMMESELPSKTAVKVVRFKLKTKNLTHLIFRFTDGSGQIHQRKVALKDTDEWQDVSVNIKNSKHMAAWGGAKDGKWHDPLKKIAIMLNSTLMSSGTLGKILIADMEFLNTVKGEDKDTLEFCGKRWSFNVGKEYPGAKGTLALQSGEGPKGQAAILLEGAFGNGGRYVAMESNLPEKTAVKVVRFKVKTTNLTHLIFRFTDGSGQIHQCKVALKDIDGWQDVSVNIKNCKRLSAWGGAKDGKWHDPLEKIAIMLNSTLMSSETLGKILVADMEFIDK
jgi:hypothetical protein